MQCLYCKKKLGLFASKKKPFCSDLHEVAYQDELAGLALRRVMDPLFTDPVQKAPLQPRPPALPVTERKPEGKPVREGRKAPWFEEPPQPDYTAQPHDTAPPAPRAKPVASPIVVPPATAALPESLETASEAEVPKFHPVSAPPPWGPFVPQIRMEPIASDLAVTDASLRLESSAAELIRLPEKPVDLIEDEVPIDDEEEDFAEHAASCQIHPAIEQEKPDPIEDPASSMLPEGYIAWPLSFGTAPHIRPLNDHELRIAAGPAVEPAAIQSEPEPEPDPAPPAGLLSLATLRLNPLEGRREPVLLQASGIDLPQPGCRCPLANIAIDNGRLSEGEESVPGPWSAVLPDRPAPIALAEQPEPDLPQRPASPPPATFAGVATGELSADVELIPRPWSAALPDPPAPIELAEHVQPGLGSPKRAVPPPLAAFTGIATGGLGGGVDSTSRSEVWAQRPEAADFAAQFEPGLLPAQPTTMLPAAAFAGIATGGLGGGVDSTSGGEVLAQRPEAMAAMAAVDFAAQLEPGPLSVQPATVLPAAALTGIVTGGLGGGIDSTSGRWSEVLAQRPEAVDFAAQLEPGFLSAQQATRLPAAALANIANGRVGGGLASIPGPWSAASPKPADPVDLPAQLKARVLATEQSATFPSATFASIATGRPGGEPESIAGPWGVQSPGPVEWTAQLASGPLYAEQAAMLPAAAFLGMPAGSLGEGVEFTARLWSGVSPKPPATVEFSAQLAPGPLSAGQATMLPMAAFVGMPAGNLGEGVEFTARLWSAVLPKPPAPVEFSAQLVPGPLTAGQATMLPRAAFLGIANGNLGEGVEFTARQWSAVSPKPPAPVELRAQLAPDPLSAGQATMLPRAAFVNIATGSLGEGVEFTARPWSALLPKPPAPAEQLVREARLEPRILPAEQTAMFPTPALAGHAHGKLGESVEWNARPWAAFLPKPSAPIDLAVQLQPGLSPERPELPTPVFAGITAVPMRAPARLEPQGVRLIAKRKALTGLRESPAKLRIPRPSFPCNDRLVEASARGIAQAISQGNIWMAPSFESAASSQGSVPLPHSPELRQAVWKETPLFARRPATASMTPFGWLPQHRQAAQFASEGAHENALPGRSPSIPCPNLEGWRELVVPRATPLEIAGNPQPDRRHRYRPSGLAGEPNSLQRFRAAAHIQIREPEFPWSIPNDLPVAAALLPWRGARIASEARQASPGTPVTLRLPLKTPVLSEARAG